MPDKTIRQQFLAVRAAADRIDRDWLPSRSSDALVVELRAIADGGIALLDAAERHMPGRGLLVGSQRPQMHRLIPDPEADRA